MSAEQLADKGRLVAVWDEPAPLFVYGSLLFPDVLKVLIGRDPKRVPSAVIGWRVVAISGKLYPGLVPSERSSASGHLLLELTDAEWRTLDAFESNFYELYRVSTDQGEPAWVYALTRAEVPLAEWDCDAFVQNSLESYLESCSRWRQGYDSGMR
jgi:gamma-glutamylcyclotransferase (GGCT)/AIG2-like uncharacterized protein YtfP